MASKKPDDSAVRAKQRRLMKLHRGIAQLEVDFEDLLGRYRQLDALITYKLQDIRELGQ